MAEILPNHLPPEDKKKCACSGLQLFVEIVDTTLEAIEYDPKELAKDAAFSDQALDVSQRAYDHLLDQANKPDNKTLEVEAKPLLDKMRQGLANYRAKGMLALEVVRDSIHKSSALQQLMMCGGPYKQDEQAKAAKELGKICDTLSNTDDDVHPPLKALAKKLNCNVYSDYF